MPINFQAATANCGNSTLGSNACKRLLHEARRSGMIFINCQEAAINATLEKLQTDKRSLDYRNLRIIKSDFRKTHTKPLAFGTGMITIVIYDSSQYDVQFEPTSHQESKDEENPNKGATINKLVLTDKTKNETYTIQTITGHLESNKEHRRLAEWLDIRAKLYPDVMTWQALVATIPDAVVLGYDANTRSVIPPDLPSNTKTLAFVRNLWHNTSQLDGRIAPFILAPIGDQVYSAEDTYKFELDRESGKLKVKEFKKETKRPGYVNAGSLDFVAVQNNTLASQETPTGDGKKHYQQAYKNISVESGTDRDHNIIVSPILRIQKVNDFQKVQNHIVKQLKPSSAKLAEELSHLEDNIENQKRLLNTYKQLLSPNGVLNKKIASITAELPDVRLDLFAPSLESQAASADSKEEDIPSPPLPEEAEPEEEKSWDEAMVHIRSTKAAEEKLGKTVSAYANAPKKMLSLYRSFSFQHHMAFLSGRLTVQSKENTKSCDDTISTFQM